MTDFLVPLDIVTWRGKQRRQTIRVDCPDEWEAQEVAYQKFRGQPRRNLRDLNEFRPWHAAKTTINHAIPFDSGVCSSGCCTLRRP